MGILSGFANSEHADAIIKQFMDGAKDMLSAAIVVGLAGGIIQILQDGHIIDPILHSLASLMGEAGKIVSLGVMYLIQTLINLIIPSGSAKAALTMPIMAPFSDVIGLSRQATVMAYQFGDGFTNMITPTSAVLMGALGIARIPYEIWGKMVLEDTSFIHYPRNGTTDSHGTFPIEWILEFRSLSFTRKMEKSRTPKNVNQNFHK